MAASHRRNKAFGGVLQDEPTYQDQERTADRLRQSEWGGNAYQPNPMGSQVLARNGNCRGSQEDGERAIEEYGKETFPNSAEERQICENIFDWWISGKSYERWYADKFLQGKLFQDD